MSPSARGIALMLVGSLFLTFSDALTKLLTGTYPTGQILFMRSLVVLPLVLAVGWWVVGAAALVPRARGLQAVRVVAAVSAEFIFVFGLAYLHLADAIAIAFAGPLIITALAGPLLGERVGWRRWAAVGVGFLGVLVIVRPTGAAFQWATLLALCATSLGAVRDIVTRRMRSTDSTFAMLWIVVAGMTLAAVPSLFVSWRTPDAAGLAIAAGAGLSYAISQLLIIEAFRTAEASLIAPFKYATLLWSVAFGMLFWGTVPTVWVLAGAALLMGSGIYVLRREARRTEIPRD